MTKIAKLFKVSDVAVLKWIRAEADKIADLKQHAEIGIVMIDEMWHFVSGKKTKFGFGGPLTGSLVACSGGYVAIVPMIR
jgi:transposase